MPRSTTATLGALWQLASRKLVWPFWTSLEHFAYRAVSAKAFPLSTLVGNGFCFHDSDHAYIYVESGNDTDGPYGIVNNKLWFYFGTRSRCSCRGGRWIFAKDCRVYGLASLIQNLMWIGTTFAIGKLALGIC